MKVKELQELLAKANPDAEVIIGWDASNYNYSPLDSGHFGDTKYVSNSTWSGIAYYTEHEDPEEYYDLEDYKNALENGADAIVLYPIN